MTTQICQDISTITVDESHIIDALWLLNTKIDQNYTAILDSFQGLGYVDGVNYDPGTEDLVFTFGDGNVYSVNIPLSSFLTAGDLIGEILSSGGTIAVTNPSGKVNLEVAHPLPPVGTNGQILTVVSGNASWQDAPSTGVISVTAGTAGTNGQVRIIVVDSEGSYNVDATVTGWTFTNTVTAAAITTSNASRNIHSHINILFGNFTTHVVNNQTTGGAVNNIHLPRSDGTGRVLVSGAANGLAEWTSAASAGQSLRRNSANTDWEWYTTSGVISITTGTINGTIAVSLDGGTPVDVPVKGLGSAAYTSVEDYTPMSHITSPNVFHASSIPNANRILLSTSNSPPAWSSWEIGTAAYASTGTAAGNVPILDVNGELPASVLPPLAITDVIEVATIAARDALVVGPGSGQVERGDIAIVTNNTTDPLLNGAWILSSESPKTWTKLSFPTNVFTNISGRATLAQLPTHAAANHVIVSEVSNGDPKWSASPLGAAAWLPIVTSIGIPGSDSNIPTEKAVRDALIASSSGVSSVNGKTGDVVLHDNYIRYDAAQTLTGANVRQFLTNIAVGVDTPLTGGQLATLRNNLGLSAGTSGQLLTSAGVGASPTWTNSASANTNSAVVRRDANGKAQVTTPVGGDPGTTIATKEYVDEATIKSHTEVLSSGDPLDGVINIIPITHNLGSEFVSVKVFKHLASSKTPVHVRTDIMSANQVQLSFALPPSPSSQYTVIVQVI